MITRGKLISWQIMTMINFDLRFTKYDQRRYVMLRVVVRAVSFCNICCMNRSGQLPAHTSLWLNMWCTCCRLGFCKWPFWQMHISSLAFAQHELAAADVATPWIHSTGVHIGRCLNQGCQRNYLPSSGFISNDQLVMIHLQKWQKRRVGEVPDNPSDNCVGLGLIYRHWSVRRWYFKLKVL